MAVMALDTHEVVKELKSVGFTDDQAEAVTRVVRRVHDDVMLDFATKADIKTALTETKLELKATIAEAKAETIKWMFGMIGFQTLVILGAVVALTRTLQL